MQKAPSQQGHLQPINCKFDSCPCKLPREARACLFWMHKTEIKFCLIEGMKYCSLAPRFYDVSRYATFFTADTETLFTLLYQHIFAQHRWENNLAHYPGPIILADRSSALPSPITMTETTPSPLLSCGGGKDSLSSSGGARCSVFSSS